jgi:hypothetical protein
VLGRARSCHKVERGEWTGVALTLIFPQDELGGVGGHRELGGVEVAGVDMFRL